MKGHPRKLKMEVWSNDTTNKEENQEKRINDEGKKDLMLVLRAAVHYELHIRHQHQKLENRK